jgi:DNA-binding LytR/AlgR family response regulator
MAVETIASNKKLICRKTIKEWEAILPESLFIRIHRSTLINIDHVARFEIEKKGSGQVFVAGRSEAFPVSIRTIAELKKRLSKN